MTDSSKHVCPVGVASGLDNRLRRLIQNPRKVLQPFVRDGMTVLDIGCGPGFFTIELANLVGESGAVIAADLQDGMLQIIQRKIAGTALKDRIVLHECSETSLGVSRKFDFVLAFYMVHEVPDQDVLFSEVAGLLEPGGQMLVVEPPVHVSKNAFKKSLEKARHAGLVQVDSPRSFLNKTALLRRG